MLEPEFSERPDGVQVVQAWGGLDKENAFNRIRIICISMPGCDHKRTEFLMRRDGVDYLRCMDCDQVFEAEDLEQIPVYDEEEDQPQRKKAS